MPGWHDIPLSLLLLLLLLLLLQLRFCCCSLDSGLYQQHKKPLLLLARGRTFLAREPQGRLAGAKQPVNNAQPPAAASAATVRELYSAHH